MWIRTESKDVTETEAESLTTILIWFLFYNRVDARYHQINSPHFTVICRLRPVQLQVVARRDIIEDAIGIMQDTRLFRQCQWCVAIHQNADFEAEDKRPSQVAHVVCPYWLVTCCKQVYPQP